MTAKEMFRKLGYKKISIEFMGDELRKIKYENISNKDRIEFYTENQHFIEINMLKNSKRSISNVRS